MQTHKNILIWNTRDESAMLYLSINPLNAELNPICHVLALVGAHHILHVSGIQFNHNTKYKVCDASWTLQQWVAFCCYQHGELHRLTTAARDSSSNGLASQNAVPATSEMSSGSDRTLVTRINKQNQGKRKQKQEKQVRRQPRNCPKHGRCSDTQQQEVLKLGYQTAWV